MTEVATSGTNPGWVYKHNARLLDSRNLVVSGGTVATTEEGEEQHKELIGEYVLCLATMTWNKRADVNG
jgi:hypothetical protein